MTTKHFKYYLAVSVSLITFAVYLPSLRNEFVGWDDGTYVFNNPFIRSLDGAFLKWAFFDFYASNWHPLTWISHALDYAVWGLNPFGHHLTNNSLHAINTFVVVLLVVRLMEAAVSRFTSHDSAVTPYDSRFTLIAAGTTGLLFGLHPIHVESVAWVAERKDLLCALFFLLSMMMYTKYAANLLTPSVPLTLRGMKGEYLFSLIFFILALLSKPMAVSLPAVLLLLDWYPFERIRSLKTFLSAAIEKSPFVILSLISSILTVLAQKKAMLLMDFVPLPTRVIVALQSLIAYLGKTILPLGLTPFYPYPRGVSLLSPEYFLPIVVLIVLSAACLVVGKKQKLWLSLWVYYVITLLPVLGVVQVGFQSMADRYMYLPSVGPFFAAGLFAAWATRKVYTSRKGNLIIKLICVASAACVVISMASLTFRQIGIWNDEVGFWSYVLQNEPERVPFAYYNRGLGFYKKGQMDKAIEDYNRAIRLDPSYAEAYANRGFVFEKIGRRDKAIADYDKAIALNPRDYGAYNNRGAIFEKMGDLDKAIADYEKALALNQGDSEAYNNLGVILEKKGDLDKAITAYDKAIALNSSSSVAYLNRGNTFDEMGRFDKAIADYDKAIALNPRDSEGYNNRGVVFEKMGDIDKAIADYDRAIALNRSNSEAYNNRRAALEKKVVTLPKQGQPSIRERTKNAVH